MTATLRRSERTMPLRELTAATTTPVATVRANLMPPEVTAKRRLGWLRRRLGVALVLLVVVVGAGYVVVSRQTDASQDELAGARQQTSELSARVGKYDALLRLQAQTMQLRTQLAVVMSSDLQWSRLLGALNATAPAGLTVTQVSGALLDPAAANATAAAAQTLPTTGHASKIGTLEVSGSARDYRSVAAYVDTLGSVRGFSGVEPGSVSSAGGKTTFTVSLDLTTAVLGGRFTSTGGK